MNGKIACCIDTLMTSNKYSKLIQFGYKIVNLETKQIQKEGMITMPYGKEVNTSMLIRTGFKYSEHFNPELHNIEKESANFYTKINSILKFLIDKNVYVVVYNEKYFREEVLEKIKKDFHVDYSTNIKIIDVHQLIEKFELNNKRTEMISLDTSYVDIFGFEQYCEKIRPVKWADNYVNTLLNENIEVLLHICQISGINDFNELYDKQHERIMLKYFTTGKYSGQEIDEVMKKDPGYINWLIQSATVLKNNPNMVYTLKIKLQGEIEDFEESLQSQNLLSDEDIE